jgi:thiamine biosynthesis protein ThiS
VSATVSVRARVNGEERELPEGTTVAALLQQLGIGTARVAVERNREIVPKSEYTTTVVAPGDALEIVEFVGGG